MGLRNCLRSHVRRASSIAALLLALTVPAAAQTNHTRHVDIYYGTWTVFMQGNATPVTTQTFVELTDHLTAGAANIIQFDASVDARGLTAAQHRFSRKACRHSPRCTESTIRGRATRSSG